LSGAGGFTRDVAVVGGCGHVGLPLAITLASRGLRVAVIDVNAAAAAAVQAGRLPFAEPGAGSALRRAVSAGLLTAGTDPAAAASAEHVIVVTGGDSAAVISAVAAARLRDGQLLVLRSTLAPGSTARVEKLLAGAGLDVDVAYCPERVAQGRAMTELAGLPQLVASRTERGLGRASRLLAVLGAALVPMTPEEAELAKLFANTWRYLTFAAANEFYMTATSLGLDYERIRRGLIAGYPRAAGLPAAGLAGGPCLPKDARLLAAAGGGGQLAAAALAVNEGLPGYLVGRLEQRFDLSELTVGILGVAFKGGCDDTRHSLAWRLRQLLARRAAAVLCTDPEVTGPGLVPLRRVLAEADVLVVGAPHRCYRGLVTAKPVADIWNVLGRGVPG
jgi:UDP-N-acetyl-D-mannosaminuronic acid dehydrogenase